MYFLGMKIDQIGFTWREKLYTEIHLDFINISSVFTFHNFWNNIWIAVHRSDKFFNNDFELILDESINWAATNCSLILGDDGKKFCITHSVSPWNLSKASSKASCKSWKKHIHYHITDTGFTKITAVHN